MCIVVEHLYVEVGIRRHEVEDVKFLVSEPVFPSFVPSFYQNLLQTILCSEVDVALHLIVCCTMCAVGLALTVVGNAETNRRHVVGVAPCLGAYNHVPPHATILCRMNPRSILYLARLVKVERKLAREHITGIVANHYGSPRCVERCLYESLTAHCIWRKPRLKHEVLVVEIEVHCRIIQASGFVYVDVQTVVGLQLQRSLHTGI